MALESVYAAETLIQSKPENDDLEDGEIPSDPDDEVIPPPAPAKPSGEPAKPMTIVDSPKHKSSFDSKFSKSKKPSSSSKQERFGKYKNPSEDWAGDVEKAIRAVLEEQDRSKNQDSSKSKSRSNRSKNRKRTRDDKEEERVKDQKKRKLSDEENGNEDDDEMLFVRGASPVSRTTHVHDTIRSPSRRSSDRDNYDNLSEHDERPNRESRQRDTDSNKRTSSSSGGGRGSTRRGGKAERGGKNKARTQIRNERNGRRNQNSDHNQDPDAICLYYMQGKCHRGDDCPYSHNALPPRKMELCKFYLMDCCAKRDKCLYMHHDFPCKFFHTGLKCNSGDNCKFSHEPLNEQVKNILLKHLETAPKEILGDFPRLSREGALMMINNTSRNAGQGQESGNQKIPSLFDVALPAPAKSTEQEEKEPRGKPAPPPGSNEQNLAVALQQKRASSSGKERKGSGKKTRWGSDEDRVPYEQIMLLQSVSQLGLHLPNVALGLAVQQQLQQHILIQQCIANMEFYNEIQGSPSPENRALKEKLKDKDNEDFTKDVGEEEIIAQSTKADTDASTTAKDVDLREISKVNDATRALNLTEVAENFAHSKCDDESDRDEEANLVIEMPSDYDDRGKDEDKNKETDVVKKETSTPNKELESIQVVDDRASKSPPRNQLSSSEDNEIPPNLPKKTQELFMRIQQQQRTAKESLAIADDKGKVEDVSKGRENWFSEKMDEERGDDDDDDDNEDEDEDDDDDDDEGGNLTIVIKDCLKDENDRSEDRVSDGQEDEKMDESVPEESNVPQPAAFVDKLGNLSKIDISAEVTKLLSAIKPQVSKVKSEPSHHPSVEPDKEEPKESLKSSSESLKISSEDAQASGKRETKRSESHSLKVENGSWSPSTTSASTTNTPSVSRDPRMSRDPRQRRGDEQKAVSPSCSDAKKDSRSLRLETSIYSSGITAMDAAMDTDLRARLDQDHRRKDMDLRQRFPQQDFGDTDLRVGPNFGDTSNWRSDVDLRQMLSLPFKPAPSHVPCTEIAASISSHPPLPYKVYVVDIPRPDYTGLKLTKNDAQVKYDPRLRKIFRLPKVEIADSPMSPPPATAQPTKPPDTPKSPPQTGVRSDPRRKPLESQASQNSGLAVPAGNPMGPMGVMAQGKAGMLPPDGAMPGMGMGMQVPPPGMGGMPSMGQNPMLGGMSGMGGGPMMNAAPMPGGNMSMGMGGPPGMPAGSGPPNQMPYDPRYAQRNGGPGLLGPAPGMPYGPEVGPPGYDGPPGYPGPPGNFPNFGPAPIDSGMMGFPPNAPNPGNFGGNGPPAEWASGNQGQMRRGGGNAGNANRVRRRNRNRANAGINRGNRSPL